jgi:sialate O-acetylesterase
MGKPTAEVPGRWEVCTPQSSPGFTAVGFYFARRIQKETGVPIGLIDDNWGGTRIEPWIPLCGFELEPSLAGFIQDVKSRQQAYRDAIAKSLTPLEGWIAATRKAMATPEGEVPDPPPMPGDPFGDAGFPTTLYNGMITPIVPYAIKGAIWYQGESNGGEGDEYYHKMRALIGGWRKVWDQGDFPFYFVQLANFQNPTDNPAGGDGWARVRMAQTKSLEIPKTGMAVIIDIGEGPDIHPKNKFDVGNRLALWALAKVYKKDLVYSGPIYKAMKIDGDKIRLSFAHVGGGLKSRDDKPLTEFEIAGTDNKFASAEATIDRDTIVVQSKDVPSPTQVKFGWRNVANPNLVNKEGLPASPFQTSNWQGGTGE